jgi:23S rRNA (pseudouridine1915-N3)-methyltransferase
MQIKIISVGKTKESYLKHGIRQYLDRLQHFGRVDYIEGKGSRSQSQVDVQLKTEGKWMLKQMGAGDFVVLLDENGRKMSSRKFAAQLNQWMSHLGHPLCFVIGGAFGFAPEVRERANFTLSLSAMTFSHQMIRLFFVEQLYRAFTILAGHSYHND